MAAVRRAGELEARVCALAAVAPAGAAFEDRPRDAASQEPLMPPTAPLGYYWGDDSYGVTRGPDALAGRLAGDGPPLERARLAGSATTADEIAERVATATLFGGGTLVIVAEPGPLVSTKPLAARRRGHATIADGNGRPSWIWWTDQSYRRPPRWRRCAAPCRRRRGGA
jgi:hypothetical protein